jgi:hypothetical protein
MTGLFLVGLTGTSEGHYLMTLWTARLTVSPKIGMELYGTAEDLHVF